MSALRTLAPVLTPSQTGVVGDGSWRVTQLSTWLGAGGRAGEDCGHALPGSSIRREVGGKVAATLVLSTESAWRLLRKRDVLHVALPGGDYEEVRITDIDRALTGAATCTVIAQGAFADLSTLDLVRETVAGRELFAFDVTRTPREILTQYLLRNLEVDGLTWLHPEPGTVEFPDAIRMSWKRFTRGQLALALAEQTLGELEWTRRSDGRYQIGLVRQVGKTVAPIVARLGDGLLSHGLHESMESLLTIGRVHGEVEGSSGEEATIGENRWRVAGVRTLDDGRPAIDLRELFGERSPVLCNGQWGARGDLAPPLPGRFLQRADGVTHLPIVGAIESTGEVILAPGAVPDEDERITITADGLGTPLTLCEITPAIERYGRVVGDVFVPGGRGERQYLLNGGLETDATGWSAHEDGVAAYIRRADLPASFAGEIASGRAAATGTGTPLALENLPVTTPATRLYVGDSLEVEAANVPSDDAAITAADGSLVLPVAPLAAAIPMGTTGFLARRATAATRTLSWSAGALEAVNVSTYAFTTPPSGGTYLDDTTTPPSERWRGYDTINVTTATGEWVYQSPDDPSVFDSVSGALPAQLAREVSILDAPPFPERLRLVVDGTSLAPAPGWILRGDLSAPLAAVTLGTVTLQRDRVAVVVSADADVSDTSIALAPIAAYTRPSSGFAALAIGVARSLTLVILSWSLVEVEPDVFRPVLVVDAACSFHTDSATRDEAIAAGRITLVGSFGSPSGVVNLQTLTSASPVDGSPTHYIVSWADLESGYTSPLAITTGSRTFNWREGISLGSLPLAATYSLSGTDVAPVVETTATVDSVPVVPAGSAVHVGYDLASPTAAEARAVAAAIADGPSAWRAPTGKIGGATSLLLTVGDARRRTALADGALLPWAEDVLSSFGQVFTGPVRVAAGSALQLAGETLIVGADVDVAGDGTASVTLAFPNTTTLGAGTIVRLARPALLDPDDRSTGRVIRLLTSVGGDFGEPDSDTPGQSITAEVVTVPPNTTRTITVASEFTLSPGTWYPPAGPVVALIGPAGEVLGWSALEEGIIVTEPRLKVRVVAQATVATTGLYTLRVYGGALTEPAKWLLFRQAILAVTTANDVPYTRDSFASAMWLAAGPSCLERSQPRIEDRITYQQLSAGVAAALGLPEDVVVPLALGGKLSLVDAATVAPSYSSIDGSASEGRSARMVAFVLKPDRAATEIELGVVSADGSAMLASASLAAGVRRARG